MERQTIHTRSRSLAGLFRKLRDRRHVRAAFSLGAARMAITCTNFQNLPRKKSPRPCDESFRLAEKVIRGLTNMGVTANPGTGAQSERALAEFDLLLKVPKESIWLESRDLLKAEASPRLIRGPSPKPSSPRGWRSGRTP